MVVAKIIIPSEYIQDYKYVVSCSPCNISNVLSDLNLKPSVLSDVVITFLKV